MSARWTNAAEVARLAGLSRERLSQLLAADALPGAVRIAIGERTFWRIPVGVASKWLRARGVTGLQWTHRQGVPGAAEDIWVGTP